MLRDLDDDVHQEEAERADGGRAVDALGEQAGARREEQPVGGDEPPDDGGGERDQSEDSTGVVEEAVHGTSR
ncbi:hypothetical protein ACFQ2B_21620 [Streptomyces stramineus]